MSKCPAQGAKKPSKLLLLVLESRSTGKLESYIQSVPWKEQEEGIFKIFIRMLNFKSGCERIENFRMMLLCDTHPPQLQPSETGPSVRYTKSSRRCVHMYVHCSRPYRVRHRKSQRDWWRRCVAGTKESMGNFTIPRTEFYRQTMRQQESGTTREMMAQQNQRQQQDQNHFNDWKFRSQQQRWSSHTNYLIYQSGLRNQRKTPKQSQKIRVFLLPRIHERKTHAASGHTKNLIAANTKKCRKL